MIIFFSVAVIIFMLSLKNCKKSFIVSFWPPRRFFLHFFVSFCDCNLVADKYNTIQYNTISHYLFWYVIRQAKSPCPKKKIIYITNHSLPARGRPLFPLLHAEKVRIFSACKKGNRRRLHAGRTTVPVDWIAFVTARSISWFIAWKSWIALLPMNPWHVLSPVTIEARIEARPL